MKKQCSLSLMLLALIALSVGSEKRAWSDTRSDFVRELSTLYGQEPPHVD
jgi:hypothetical protein